MNIKKILFPTDFSRDNDQALRLASTLAAESGATLLIAHVDELRDLTAAMGEAGYLMATAIEDRQEVVDHLEPRFTNRSNRGLRALLPEGLAGERDSHLCCG